jgi:hypothetical protein
LAGGGGVVGLRQRGHGLKRKHCASGHQGCGRIHYIFHSNKPNEYGYN